MNQFPAEFVSYWAEGLQVQLALVSWGPLGNIKGPLSMGHPSH